MRAALSVATGAFLWYQFQSCTRKLDGNLFLLGGILGMAELGSMYHFYRKIKPVTMIVPPKWRQ
jgi:hypothetical protein